MSKPLIVDLDGTLIFTDMFNESLINVLHKKPWYCFLVLYWWFSGGIAHLKRQLAKTASIDVSTLPYNSELLNWLKLEKEKGRHLILCTGSDHMIASLVANHLELFDEVLASDGITNLVAHNKASALNQRFGIKNYDYCGNSKDDLVVWKDSHQSIVVNAPNYLLNKAQKTGPVSQVFSPKISEIRVLPKMLRVHQWLKNILLFVPIIAAHEVDIFSSWVTVFAAFIAFSLCSSAVYIINDLIDLENDRLHPNKKTRAFASGKIALWKGLFFSPLLLILSFMIGIMIEGNFIYWIIIYFLLTCAYSLGLKKIILIDCLTLAILYTLRIIAGAEAAHLSLSFWLLACSVFIFLSLSFIKRYTEMTKIKSPKQQTILGRGYIRSDAPIIKEFGIASGFAAVVVLALYLHSSTVLILYKTPQLIWGTVIILLYWINWMWMQTYRGLMDDDPVFFAIKDPISILSGLCFVLMLILGSLDWSWL